METFLYEVFANLILENNFRLKMILEVESAAKQNFI